MAVDKTNNTNTSNNTSNNTTSTAGTLGAAGSAAGGTADIAALEAAQTAAMHQQTMFSIAQIQAQLQITEMTNAAKTADAAAQVSNK